MQSASLEVRFSTPGLSEHRKALSDLKRESKDAADSTRSMVAEMTASIDRLSNARRKMSDEERLLRNARSEERAGAIQDASDARTKIRLIESEIAATKRLVESKRAAQSVIDSYNKDQSSAGKARSGYVDFWTKSLNARERDEKRAADAIIKNEERITAAKARESAAQARLEYRVASAGGYGPSRKNLDADELRETKKALSELNAEHKASANQPSMFDRAALWVTGLNQAISLAERLGRTAKSFIDDAAKWESMDMSLKLMEGSAQGATNATADLYQIAKAPAIDLKTAQQAYIQLRAMHIAGSDAKEIIVDISNTIGRAGGGSSQFERTMLQLKDMISTGQVYQKDLRLMKEAMPEMASLMEQAFGETSAEGIRKLKINSVDFLKGLMAEMEKLPKPVQTLTSEMENFETAVSRAKASLVDTEFTKTTLQNWTAMIEGMTSLITAESINWSKLIRGAFNGFSEYKPKEQLGWATAGGVVGGVLGTTLLPGIGTMTGVGWGAAAGTLAGGAYHAISGASRNDAGLTAEETDRAKIKEIFDNMRAARQKAGDTSKSPMTYFGKDESYWSGAITRKYTAPPAPHSKTLDELSAEAKIREDKKKADEDKKKITEEQQKRRAQEVKELQSQLDANKAKLDAEKAYQKTLDDLKAQGFNEADARIEADAEKKTTEAVALWEKQKQTAGAGSKMLAEINSQHEQAIIQIRHDANEKLGENYRKRQEVEAKDIDDLKKKIEDKRKAIEDAEIKLQEMKDAEKTKWQVRADEIQSQYADEITQIQEQADRKLQILEIAGRKTVELEERINQERRNKENAYYTSRMKIGLDGTSSLFGALAEMEMARVDKMSDTYKTMFAIQKSFAIASATVNVVSAAASALNDWAAASTFERIALAGGVMAAGGGLISQITSTAYAGVFDKGGDIPYGSFGVAGENGPEIVKGPAHVTSTKDTARMLAGAGRAPVVNVYNNAGANVEAKVNSDGSIDLLIDRVVAAAEGRIASGITSGNGSVDRSLRSTYGLGRGK